MGRLFQSTLPRRSDPPRPRNASSQRRFQSTLPRRSDHHRPRDVAVREGFNPRSREGATFDAAPPDPVFGQVSIHAPAKERPRRRCSVARAPPFQSTLPRRSDRGPVTRVNEVGGFNPRSREGATDVDLAVQSLRIVSIHAPAKERLPRGLDSGPVTKVSIHAPAKERHERARRIAGLRRVSIHAPAKERHRAWAYSTLA